MPHPAAEREEVARPDHDLEVVHRALEEVGGAGVQRPQAERAVVVGGDDDQRDCAGCSAWRGSAG
jgi:hypothetical protein